MSDLDGYEPGIGPAGRSTLVLRVLLALVVVAAAVGVYVAVTRTGGHNTAASSPSGTPSPTASLSSSPEPAPSSTGPAPTPAASVGPSVAPTVSAAPHSSASAVARPAPSGRPSAPSSAPPRGAYPRPGLGLAVQSQPITGNPPGVAFTIRVTDNDGRIRSLSVDYGDGTTVFLVQRRGPSCATTHTSPEPGYRPEPLDQSFHTSHHYSSGGTFTSVIRATTDRPCEAAPVESDSRTFVVSVPAFTPNPTASPTPSATASPTASPSPSASPSR